MIPSNYFSSDYNFSCVVFVSLEPRVVFYISSLCAALYFFNTHNCCRLFSSSWLSELTSLNHLFLNFISSFFFVLFPNGQKRSGVPCGFQQRMSIWLLFGSLNSTENVSSSSGFNLQWGWYFKSWQRGWSSSSSRQHKQHHKHLCGVQGQKVKPRLKAFTTKMSRGTDAPENLPPVRLTVIQTALNIIDLQGWCSVEKTTRPQTGNRQEVEKDSVFLNVMILN